MARFLFKSTHSLTPHGEKRESLGGLVANAETKLYWEGEWAAAAWQPALFSFPLHGMGSQYIHVIGPLNHVLSRLKAGVQ